MNAFLFKDIRINTTSEQEKEEFKLKFVAKIH